MDIELRHQILRALARDRTFLKSSAHHITPQDFPTVEERLIAEAALTFYGMYTQPIGNLLRSTVEELVIQSKKTVGSDTQERLKSLLGTLYGTKMELVSVQALEDRVLSLKRTTFYENAMEEILVAHEQNQLNPTLLSGLVERANRELGNRLDVEDYLDQDELERRIERRRLYADKQFPIFMIPVLDKAICGIGRGHTGLILAPFSSGKGMALLHLDRVYAMQGLNVLHITLEDPRELVESRLDAAISGIPMGKLERLPNRLRNKFYEMARQIRGRIKIIDGTDGGWTLTRIVQAVEQLRQEGLL